MAIGAIIGGLAAAGGLIEGRNARKAQNRGNEARAAANRERDRLIQQAQEKINTAFTSSKAGRERGYSAYQDSIYDSLERNIDATNKSNKASLLFSAANRGTLGSSNQAANFGEEDDNYQAALGAASIQSQVAADKERSIDIKDRDNLLLMALEGATPSQESLERLSGKRFDNLLEKPSYGIAALSDFAALYGESYLVNQFIREGGKNQEQALKEAQEGAGL